MRLIVVNRYWVIIPIFISIFIIVILNIKKDKESITTFSSPVTNKVIVLDAGHGGMDPGAVGKMKKKESELNLAIVLKLRQIIEENGGIVILTRENNEGLYTEQSKSVRAKKREDLRNRKELVNKSDADILVSIHLNSFTSQRSSGAQVFYKSGSVESEKLGNYIQLEFKNFLNKKNTRQPQSRKSIYLIRESKVPSVLLECGFISNNSEEKLLNSPEYQDKVAWSIYVGLVKYFNKE